jgi:DNA-binding transcriptional LysR family regulator
MNWAHVHTFLAVARTGQILKAARQLNLNHATVGRQVMALEQSLGARLIDRQNQGCTLTPAGEALLVAAEKAESELLRVGSEISGTAATISGVVRVGAPDGLGNYFLSQELASLSASHPELVVSSSHSLAFFRYRAGKRTLRSPSSAGRRASCQSRSLRTIR